MNNAITKDLTLMPLIFASAVDFCVGKPQSLALLRFQLIFVSLGKPNSSNCDQAYVRQNMLLIKDRHIDVFDERNNIRPLAPNKYTFAQEPYCVVIVDGCHAATHI